MMTLRLFKIACVFLMGITLGGESSRAQAPVSQVRIGDTLVPEEVIMTGGGYITPNERDVWRFKKVMTGKTGALISVGTFRSLSDIGFGDFSQAVLMDYDSGTTAFNRLNLEMIRKSPDRLSYLNELLGLGLDREKIAAMSTPEKEVAEIRKLYRDLYYSESKPAWFDAFFGSIDKPEDVNYFRNMILLFAQDPKNGMRDWQASIFGSDEAFAKVKRMLGEGRIHVVTGNLSGKETFKAVGDALRKMNVQVSVLDVSNAIDYMLPLDMSFQSRRKSMEVNFVENLKTLPWSKDAVFAYTYDPSLRKYAIWEYFALPAREFVEKADKTGLAWVLRKGVDQDGHLHRFDGVPLYCIDDILRSL